MNVFQRPLQTVLALAVLSLLVGGAWFYRTQEMHLQLAAEQELHAVANLKVNQIAHWRADQLAEGDELTASRFFIDGVERWLAKPGPEPSEEILSRFRSLRGHYDYLDILLVDAEGRVRLSLSGRLEALHADDAQALSIALHTRKSVLTDLHTGDGAIPQLAVIAPLFSWNEAAAKPVGAVVLQSDARKFLYALLGSWPAPSETAETLLVRRDGDSVLFLNELRFQANTALKLRIPLDQTNVPAVMAVLGREGIMQGTDYRGVEVLSVLKTVPDSTWFMVCKVDVAEIFAAWRFRSHLILALLGALLALVVTAVFVVWQRNQKAHYRALYQTEVARLASAARHAITLQSIADAVIATDAHGRVELLNPAAETLTGWANEEARGKPLEDVFRIINEETRQPVESPVHRVLCEGVVVGLANHTLLVARDGSERPIADSGAPIRDEQNQIIGVVLVFRDRTQERLAQKSLQNTTARLQFLLTATPAAIYCCAVTPPYGATFVSANVAALLGYEPHEFVDDSDFWAGHIHPDDKPRVMAGLPRLFEDNHHRHEYRFRHKDGSYRWMLDELHLVRDQGGEPREITGCWVDITERKLSEEALKLFRSLMEQSNDAVEVVDPETERFLDANERACAELGYTREEFLSLKVPDIDPIVDKSAFPKVVAELRKSGSMTMESLRLRKDGTRFPVEVSLRFVQLERDYLVAIVRDITERNRAEEHIRKQAAFLDAANDAILVRTMDHAVTYWNKACERLYDWPRSEALGRKITELAGFDAAAFEAANAALLEQGFWSGELNQTARTGKKLVVFCRWTLLRDEQGRPKEVLVINTDITEQKQLETQFLRAQRMEGIGLLAGGIAHDLNNILAPILMSTSLLREIVDNEEGRSMIDTMEGCAKRGADIIKQLLTFARGRPDARMPLPMRHFVKEMEKIIRETFPRQIQPSVDVPQDLWPVVGDATQIHQALMNLCVNARDAMPDGGTLTLVAGNVTLDEGFAALIPDAKPGDYVCVTVSDTGRGIPQEHLERIFDPFFTTKEIGKGTGLGLPTVLGIVRGHGGFVRLKSRAGEGAAFELYFPASPEAKAASESESETPPQRGQGELILVVDDEAGVRDVIQRALEKQGYRVVAAAEGAEALALFAGHRAEVKAVVTDMMMPGMDGPSLVRMLRDIAPQLPILGMTGLTSIGGGKGLESLDLPVVLIKPFTRVKLLAALHATLTKQSMGPD